MTTENTGLTTLDIKALRSCDRFVFQYDRDKGISVLEAVKDKSDKSPWDQRHEIKIATITHSYQAGYRVIRAFAIPYVYKWDHNPVNTFLEALRPGDVVEARVLADAGNNGYAADAGLHIDYIRLEIVRGKRRLVHLIDVSCCPDNLARPLVMEAIT